MYLQYTFLLTDFYDNEFIPSPLEFGSIVIPVNKLLWEEKAYYFQKLYATSTTFCFGFFQADLGWKATGASYIRDSLSLYFFLPNYAKKGGFYLLVSDLDTGRNCEVMDTTQSLLETQGITPLSVNYTDKDSRISTLNKHYHYSNDLIEAFNKKTASIDFSALFKKIVAEDGFNKQIVLTVKDEEDFRRKTGVINDFEHWVLDNEKTYADLLSMANKTNDKYLKLQNDNEKLRFRLDNYNDYLKAVRSIAKWYVDEYHRISREKSIVVPPSVQQIPSPIAFHANEVNHELHLLRTKQEEILQWYMKEYEVLPLWYKRFGHLIKIATGKKKMKEYLHRPKKL